MSKNKKESADLLLRLYEIRREDKMRKAREWVLFHMNPSHTNDIIDNWYSGSLEDSYLRMTASYWEMVCVFVAEGILDKELFFKTTSENLVVWKKISPFISALRVSKKLPQLWRTLEVVSKEHLEFRNKTAQYWVNFDQNNL